jgi:dCMP deaminase
VRPDLDLWYMRMARLVATRSTCLRKAVGCVLVDARGHQLATGYNGVARGRPHCNQRVVQDMAWHYPHACHGALEKGGALELCEAVHAEQNAFMQCANVELVRTVYVTLSPCDSCLKLMLNTGATRLVVGEWWRDSEANIKSRWQRDVSLETRQ